MFAFKHQRSSYIPKGAVKVTDKESGAVAYLYTVKSVPYAIAFHGKAQKPDWHFRFRNEADREKRVSAHFAGERRRAAAQAQRRAARKAEVNPFQVDDVLSTCWGYEQTNREFYQVVEVRGSMVVIREIAAMSRDVGWCQHKISPKVGQFIGEPMRRRAKGGYVRISSCIIARPARFELVAGVKVYEEQHTTSYA